MEAQSPMPPRPHPFVPFRLFCSTAVSKGMADDDPCKQFFVTLREAIGFDDGDGSGRNDRGCFVNDDKDGNSLGNRAFHWLVITSFLLDVEYLFEELPEIIKYQKVIVYYGSVEGNSMQAMRQWEQVLGNSGKTVEFIRLVPSDPPYSATNPLPFKLPYGVHHSKFFLSGYEEEGKHMCRIGIHSANLRRSDIERKTQGIYVQDFPAKAPKKQAAAAVNPYKRAKVDEDDDLRQFEDDLITYMESYRYYVRGQIWFSPSTTQSGGLTDRSHSILTLLRRYDFSCAYAVLVPSVPGYHQARDMPKFGYYKIHKAVKNARSGRAGSNQSSSGETETPKPIIFQVSSLGTIQNRWLIKLLAAIDSNCHRNDPSTYLPAGKSIPQGKTPPLETRMKLVWPTVEEVRTCVEGYAGGGAIPGTTEKLDKDFLLPLYHRWSNPDTNILGPLRTARYAPHIKTFVQPGDGDEIHWMVLTSHNLSKPSLGEFQTDTKTNERRLMIQHWELVGHSFQFLVSFFQSTLEHSFT
mmetsp:Transcript_1424/g.3377  ORF Transcript_1424/g.3377 Transcript_1424/m.3377 type:complete len:522 (-) Transcript_1424:338-1903(-)